jgi:serine/threonine protein kinase
MVRVGDYDLLETIGSGAFSKVKTVLHGPSQTNFVAKIVSKREGNVEKEVRLEIAILRRVVHPNVVRLIEILESANNYYIILEPVLGGDLCDLIMKDENVSGLPLAQVRRLFSQLVSGISACHAVGVAHRDLKPENLLITENGMHLKISDFGLSRLHRRSEGSALANEYAKTLTGTLAYVSPEVLVGRYDAFKADIWSMGCILYVMSTGRFPFGSAVGEELEQRIKTGVFEPMPNTTAGELRDLVAKMLVYEPDRRLPLEDIRAHPFLKEQEEIRIAAEKQALLDSLREAQGSEEMDDDDAAFSLVDDKIFDDSMSPNNSQRFRQKQTIAARLSSAPPPEDSDAD